MLYRILIILTICLPIRLFSQEKTSNLKLKYNFNKQRVIRLSNLNSKFDDLNVYIQLNEKRKDEIIFSTNRLTQGENFDLISYKLKLKFNTRSRKGYVKAKHTDSETARKVNSSDNEFGPNYIYDHWYKWKYFSFTSDKNGNDDIFLINVSDTILTSNQKGVIEFSGINTIANEGYLSYDIQSDRSILYQSDKHGNFDIMGFMIPDSVNNMNVIPKLGLDKINNDSINTKWNEKYPNALGGLLVFCSDRPESNGGYDIYYSIWDNDNKTFCSPIRFVDEINSLSNEYRPFLIEISDLTFLVFSSDRSGGKGGFDLYFACINDIVYPDYIYTFSNRSKWHEDKD